MNNISAITRTELTNGKSVGFSESKTVEEAHGFWTQISQESVLPGCHW